MQIRAVRKGQTLPQGNGFAFILISFGGLVTKIIGFFRTVSIDDSYLGTPVLGDVKGDTGGFVVNVVAQPNAFFWG